MTVLSNRSTFRVRSRISVKKIWCSGGSGPTLPLVRSRARAKSAQRNYPDPLTRRAPTQRDDQYSLS
jgi:hypothetical protein